MFLLDGASTGARLLATPTTGGRSATWDADVDWFAWYEGSFVFGDSGSLDLGLVRDSNLNVSNKVETFYQSFELLARVGGYRALHVTSSLCAGGDSQVATDIATCSPMGS